MWFVVVLVWLCYVSVGGWGKGVIVISCRTVAFVFSDGRAFFSSGVSWIDADADGLYPGSNKLWIVSNLI